MGKPSSSPFRELRDKSSDIYIFLIVNKYHEKTKINSELILLTRLCIHYHLDGTLIGMVCLCCCLSGPGCRILALYNIRMYKTFHDNGIMLYGTNTILQQASYKKKQKKKQKVYNVHCKFFGRS